MVVMMKMMMMMIMMIPITSEQHSTRSPGTDVRWGKNP